LQIEEPVSGRYASAFHFRPTLAGMLRAPLVGHQVVQMDQPSQERVLAPLRMMEAFPHEQLPVDGVMYLIEGSATQVMLLR
jgi:hypothetical protein